MASWAGLVLVFSSAKNHFGMPAPEPVIPPAHTLPNPAVNQNPRQTQIPSQSRSRPERGPRTHPPHSSSPFHFLCPTGGARHSNPTPSGPGPAPQHAPGGQRPRHAHPGPAGHGRARRQVLGEPLRHPQPSAGPGAAHPGGPRAGGFGTKPEGGGWEVSNPVGTRDTRLVRSPAGRPGPRTRWTKKCPMGEEWGFVFFLAFRKSPCRN